MEECCGPPQDPTRYTAIFDARFARKIAKRYARAGLTQAEQAIVDAVEAVGVRGRTVLEVGGGVGEIQLALLERGAASTTNLELSSEYEQVATELIDRAGVADRVTRLLGIDRAERADTVAEADIVILHRVVCCYPDYERLLGSAADHARRLLVFSHPPRTPATRLDVAFGNAMLRLRGRSYRGFVHPPEEMARVVAGRGLHPRRSAPTRSWHLVTAPRA